MDQALIVKNGDSVAGNFFNADKSEHFGWIRAQTFLPAKGVRVNCRLLSLKSENSVHNEEGNFYAKALGQGLDHL